MMRKHRFALFLMLGLCLAVCLMAAGALADGDPTFTFDATTQTLTLTGGDYTKGNDWGDDLDKYYVRHINAQSGVRFVGDCRSLFSSFSSCKDIDLHNVDVSGMTFAWDMFSNSMTSINVTGWDVTGVTDMNGIFSTCRKVTSLDLSSWDVSGVTNMQNMFYECNSLTSLNTTGWDVSHVTNMQNTFGYCSGLVTLDLSGWNVSSVTNMYCMFDHCTKLKNLNVANWNVSSVTDMGDLFENCSSLTALDLSAWNVSSVTNMAGMFTGCSGLTSLNVSGWNTAKLKYISYLFSGCTALTSLDLTGWNVYNCEYAYFVFQDVAKLRRLTLSPPKAGATLYNNQASWYLNNGENGEGWVAEGTEEVVSGTGQYAVIPAPAEVTTFVWNPKGPRSTYDSDTGVLTLNYGTFDTAEIWANIPKASVLQVTANEGVRFTGDCSGLFYDFEACEAMDLHQVNTSGMTDTSGMFAKCYNVKTLNLAGWDTSAVTDMSFMFQDCSWLETLSITGWNTASVANMEYLFEGCLSLATVDVADWDTASVTNMESLFRNCYDLAALDLSGWDTSSVTNMSHMFYSVSNELTELDLSAWDVSQVTMMDYMFKECYSLTTLTLPAVGITSVTDVEGMFKDCYALTALDLSGFTLTQGTTADYLFQDASSLARLTLPADVGVGDFMYLNNGDWHYSDPGWIVYGDATAAVVSGDGEYAVIAPAEQATTYVWKLNVADHPAAVTAFDAEGHWLYCPDCGRGLEGTYEEHEIDWEEEIQRVQITVPNSQAQSLSDLPADTPLGIGNTVQFINDTDHMSFTYLPDDSGRISCRNDESDSLYLPGGFATTPNDPAPETTRVYAVVIPGAAMDMWVEYDSCGYGYLQMMLAHGDKCKIWADKFFAQAGETVTFGVSTFAGYKAVISVKCGNTTVPYAPSDYANEYTFTMPTGNVKLEITAEPLPRLYLPANTKTISASAFENSGAQFVLLPDGCTSIGANAFKNCKSLEAILIPKTVTTIDDTAFDGCKSVCIFAEQDSVARDYAYAHNNTYFWPVEELEE